MFFLILISSLVVGCACGAYSNQSSSATENSSQSVYQESTSSEESSFKDSSSENSSVDDQSSTLKEKYIITYETGLKTGVEITAKTQEAYYGEEITLYTPTHTDYVFVKWVIKGTDTEVKSGVYTFTENITLEAVWKEDGNGDYGFL